MFLFSVISPFLKFGWRIIKVYFWISLIFICYFFTVFIVGIATRSAKDDVPDIVVPQGELAPVALGNPFLPYRDVSPTPLTGSPWHTKGIEVDYVTPYGTPLYAPMICPCTITGKGIDAYENTYIYLSSEDGVYDLLYMHGDYTVSPGDIVAPGTRIGTEASHGNSSEPHTHVEVQKNGVYVDPRKFDNTAFVTSTGTKDMQHTGKHGNYGSVLSSYDGVQLRMSHYDPSLGGINCDADCTTMASGEKVAAWTLGQNGIYAAACPQEIPMGTKIRVNEVTFKCLDRGSYINCYDIGDYDPALKRDATLQYCWIDALGSFGYSFGDLVPANSWGFIK